MKVGLFIPCCIDGFLPEVGVTPGRFRTPARTA
jgi:hypothetical protein